MKYEHIFFDLDGTIWDFKRNSQKTLENIHALFIPQINKQSFIQQYRNINNRLWDQYKIGKISVDFLRNQRFQLTMEKLNLGNPELSTDISDYYLSHCPKETTLINGAKSIIQHLDSKGYNLHILTNGFNDLQVFKLKNCGIDNYFDKVMCADTLGYSKPHRAAFNLAMQITNSNSMNSIMIGDSMNDDILGAQMSGMDQIYFNPTQQRNKTSPTFEIQRLSEIQEILGE